MSQSLASKAKTSDLPVSRDLVVIMSDLMIHVIPSVATRWYELGMVLLEPKYHNELTIIEADVRNDAVTCYRKMFSKWLNTDELASWDKLIKAVRIVQLNNVANDIEQSLLQANSKPSKKKLLELVPHVAPQWYVLGIQLLREDQESRLDIIKADHGHNIVESCTEMFWLWLKSHPSATWHQLIESLKSPAVNLHSVAADIEKMFTDIQSSIPVNEKQEKILQPDFSKFTNVSSAFVSLTTSVTKCLANGDIGIIRRACIVQIQSPNGAQLSPDVVEKIRNAQNLDALLDILTATKYWSWIDLRLLEALVVASGSSTAQDIVKKYKEAVYSKKLKEVLPDAPSEEIKDAYFTKIVSKVGKSSDEITVADLLKFRSKLETVIMDINNGCCVLEHIADGCIEIHWVIPTHYIHHAYKVACINRHKFHEFHLLYLQIGNYPVLLDPFTSHSSQAAVIRPSPPVNAGLPAPNNVQATAISHSSIEVTWDQLCDATEYTISYSTNASHISGGSVTVKGTTGTLSGLVENTIYTITVQAMTGNSRKNAVSSEVSVITHAAVPSSLPQNITMTSTDPALLKVSWQPPLESHNVPITSYVIQYIKDGSQDTIKDIKNIGGTIHKISGLVPCTKYSVKVAALNDDRTGLFNEPVVEISEDVPSEPCSLREALVTSTTVTLQWMPPETPNGFITHYSIQYGGRVIDKFGSETLNRMTGTVEGLSPNTLYMLQLTAHTRVGPGPPASLSVKTAPTTLLYEIERLKARYLKVQQLFRSDWPKHSVPKYIKLALIEKEEVTLKDEHLNKITKFSLKDSTDKILKKKTPLDGLNEIFHYSNQPCPRIQIMGGPGIGKTTLANEIYIKCAKERFLTDDFAAVILILLREVQKTSLEGKIKKLFGEENYEKLKKSIGKKCLMILEGLDEMSTDQQQSIFFTDLTICYISEEATIMITSRPHACTKLTVDRKIEVIGFGKAEIEEFANISLDNGAEFENFKCRLKDCPNLLSLCYVPLSLMMIVDMLKSKQSALPSKLYQYFIVMILQRQCHIKKAKIIFTVEDLEQCGFQVTDDSDGFGLLKATYIHEVAAKDSCTYTFVHLSIQECLCPLYIATLPAEEQLQIYKKYRYHDAYHNMFALYSGMTQLSCEEVLKEVFVDLTEWGCSPASARRLVYESQSGPPQSASPFTFENSVVPFLPYDILCISYVLSHYPVTKLNMEYSHLDDEQIELLANDYKSNEALKILDLNNNGLTSEGIKHVMNIITNSPSFDKLDVSKNLICDEGMLVIADGLQHNHTLTELLVENCNLSTKGIEHIKQSLPKLKYLDISHNSIGDDGLRHIMESLESSNSMLTELHMQRCQLSAKGITYLKILLEKSERLQCLNVSYNSIGNDGVKCIKEGLEQNNTLIKLNISSCDVKGDGNIKEIVERNTKLKCLDISDNTIGDDGVQHITQGLQNNDELRELNLSKCRFSAKAADCIKEIIMKDTIQSLIIGGNRIRDSGMKSIAEGFQHNHSLTILKTHRCLLNEEGAITISEIIKENYTLECLDIRDNSIGDKGIEAIAQQLAHTRIMELTVAGCGFTDNGAKSLADGIKNNQTIGILDVLYNYITVDGARSILEATIANNRCWWVGINREFLDADIKLKRMMDIIEMRRGKTVSSDDSDDD